MKPLNLDPNANVQLWEKVEPPPMPTPGHVYVHYKGNYYQVIAVARHSETQEWLVVYARVGMGLESYRLDSRNVWCRPLEMFSGRVDKHTWRFMLCKSIRQFEFPPEGEEVNSDEGPMIHPNTSPH